MRSKFTALRALCTIALGASLSAPAMAQSNSLDRSALPIPEPVPPGKATIRFEFAYDGGGLGKGGTGRILLNGTEIAKGRIDKTQCCVIALDETADVGKANGTPASNEYDVPFAFTGTIDRVVISLGGTGAAGVDA